MFARIFICPKCGDVWRDVEPVEIIDADRDEVWTEMFCSCGREVRAKEIDGKPVYHALSDEEIEAELFYPPFPYLHTY